MFENFSEKKILITGGLGFIGSNLAIRLVELGAEVTIVDSLIESCGGNEYNISDICDKVEVFRIDLRNSQEMIPLIQNKDYIFNLAGKTSHIDSITDPLCDFELNCVAHFNFLTLCKEYNSSVKILYTSTRQIYGMPHYLPVDEKHPINPTDINGLNKYCAERYHFLFYKIYCLPTVILRLTNIYGPRQLIKHNRYGVTGWSINRIITDNEMLLYDDGSLVRDFIFVDDVVEALLLVAVQKKSTGEIYNLSGDKPYSLREFTDTLISIAGKGKIRYEPLPKEMNTIGVGNYYADCSKIRRDIGWKPKVDLNTGLKKTIEYFIRNKEHYL